MFAAINQFFAMFASLFSAGEKFATSLDNVATVTVEKSQAFVDDARAQRAQALLRSTAATKAVEAEVKK